MSGSSSLPDRRIHFSGNDSRGFQSGINNGSIHFHSHASAEASTGSEPRPFSNVPFRRNPDYINRGDILSQLEQKLSVPSARAALVGLGGVGKSQLAIEYSYRVSSQSLKPYVFWVHASNEARFEESFRSIAHQLRLLRPDQEAQTNVLQLVHDWLMDEINGPWVLIVDNADDLDVFFASKKRSATGGEDGVDGSRKDLALFLPQSSSGKILITSRFKEVARRLVAQHRDMLEVNAMPPDEALSLLQNKMDIGQEQPEAIALLRALDFIPLAIDQAAAYIMQRRPRASISRYLKDLHSNETAALALLSHDLGDIYRDSAASNSILSTWKVSLEYIRKYRLSSAKLLSYMSCFNCQAIPDFLLHMDPSRSEYKPNTSRPVATHMFYSKKRQQCEQNSKTQRSSNTNESEKVHHRAASARLTHAKGLNTSRQTSAYHRQISETERAAFDEDILLLQNFSLINISEDGLTFQMHPLVQFATKAWLEDSNETAKWESLFLSTMAKEFPGFGRWEDSPTCKKLLPHVNFDSDFPSQKDALRNWVILFTNAASYQNDQGHLITALQTAKKAYDAEKALEKLESTTMQSAVVLATILYNVGQFEESLSLRRNVLKRQIRLLGREHERTLWTMGALADTLTKLGAFDEAEELLKECSMRVKARMGDQSFLFITTLQYMVKFQAKKGNYEKAEALSRDLTKKAKRICGENSFHFFEAMLSLGDSLQELGRIEEAKKIYLNVLSKGPKFLNDEDDTLVDCRYGLGILFYRQGEYEVSESILQQALRISEKYQGRNAHRTKVIRKHLVLVLRARESLRTTSRES